MTEPRAEPHQSPHCGDLETIPGSEAEQRQRQHSLLVGTVEVQPPVILATAHFTPVITWAEKATTSELLPGAGACLGSGLCGWDQED